MDADDRHIVTVTSDEGPWREWHAECSCGWFGSWHKRRVPAINEGAQHQGGQP